MTAPAISDSALATSQTIMARKWPRGVSRLTSAAVEGG
jgi:hypothetical protein